MYLESEAAAGWAAMLVLSLFIAVTIVAGCYFYIYSLEARDMRADRRALHDPRNHLE
jgi:hypothetical protein